MCYKGQVQGLGWGAAFQDIPCGTYRILILCKQCLVKDIFLKTLCFVCAPKQPTPLKLGIVGSSSPHFPLSLHFTDTETEAQGRKEYLRIIKEQKPNGKFPSRQISRWRFGKRWEQKANGLPKQTGPGQGAEDRGHRTEGGGTSLGCRWEPSSRREVCMALGCADARIASGDRPLLSGSGVALLGPLLFPEEGGESLKQGRFPGGRSSTSPGAAGCQGGADAPKSHP